MTIPYENHVEEMAKQLYSFRKMFAFIGIEVYYIIKRLEYLLDKCHIQKYIIEIKQITIYATKIFNILISKQEPFYIKPLPLAACIEIGMTEENEDNRKVDESIFNYLN